MRDNKVIESYLKKHWKSEFKKANVEFCFKR